MTPELQAHINAMTPEQRLAYASARFKEMLVVQTNKQNAVISWIDAIIELMEHGDMDNAYEGLLELRRTMAAEADERL